MTMSIDPDMLPDCNLTTMKQCLYDDEVYTKYKTCDILKCMNNSSVNSPSNACSAIHNSMMKSYEYCLEKSKCKKYL
jgi:hypothetical protein